MRSVPAEPGDIALRDNCGMPLQPNKMRRRTACLTALALWLATAAAAQDKPVYRCPGPPVLYTDALSIQEARDRGCRTIEGVPVTVFAAPPRPSRPSAAAPAAAGASIAAGRPAESRIDPSEQRARDSDARRILGDELRREEERLVALRTEFNNGEPERRGDERNYQRYLDRVGDLRSSISRKEADLAAIRRELAKLPQ